MFNLSICNMAERFRESVVVDIWRNVRQTHSRSLRWRQTDYCSNRVDCAWDTRFFPRLVEPESHSKIHISFLFVCTAIAEELCNTNVARSLSLYPFLRFLRFARSSPLSTTYAPLALGVVEDERVAKVRRRGQGFPISRPRGPS